MLYANDKSGNRVCIDDVIDRKDVFYCPTCGGKLVQKRGLVKAHHFAHHPSVSCTDKWHYDMSEWHRRWQSFFPREALEIVKEYGGQKHRADVLLEKEKTVYEFQHSPISSEEFSERNAFYSQLGYKVIWVFDVTDDYEKGELGYYSRSAWFWEVPKGTFLGFNRTLFPNVFVYLQISNDPSINPKMCEISNMQGEVDASLKIYYDDHKYDTDSLLLVETSSDNWKYFGTDGRIYSPSWIMPQDIRVEAALPAFIELEDKLEYLKTISEARLFFGCPNSEAHIATDRLLEGIKDYKTIGYGSCFECEHSRREEEDCYCKARFSRLGLKITTPITDIKVDQAGNVIGFAAILGADKKEMIVRKKPVKGPTTLFDLWIRYELSTPAVLKNVKLGLYAKLIDDPYDQYCEHGRVYGYLSPDATKFSGPLTMIVGVSRAEWILAIE